MKDKEPNLSDEFFLPKPSLEYLPLNDLVTRSKGTKGKRVT